MKVKKVSEILLFTQDMMLALIEERWDQLMDMQSKQDTMLHKLFSQPDLMLSDLEKNDLFEVQRLNQEILKAAEATKSDIARELRTMKQGKAKANVYQAL